MSVADKVWALNQIRHKRNAFILTCAGMYLVNSDSVQTLENVLVMLTKSGIIFNPTDDERVNGRHEVSLNQIIKSRSEKNSDFLYDIAELYKFTRRNLVKESFEVVTDYAEYKSIMPKLRLEAWFRFARIIRNAISHDFHCTFDKHDRACLPVRWEGKIIDISMLGKEMTQDMLDPLTTMRLIGEIGRFIEFN